jgi:hypothetical protein
VSPIEIDILWVDSDFVSYFSKRTYPLQNVANMFISDRQQALNFRHRKSAAGYQSDWHVAGDPTLIIVQQGTIELETRSGETRRYSAGEQFIAADYLPSDIVMDAKHGHRAKVVSKVDLQAIHIKLDNQPLTL